MRNPRILVLIPTLNENPTETILSITRQTMKVSKIILIVGSQPLFNKLLKTTITSFANILYFRPCMEEPLGLRVTRALNYALSSVSIKEYDYILKVDADVLLPKNFIEENLKVNVDIVGGSGRAMLIKSQTFLKVFKGRFPEVASDDTFLNLCTMSKGGKVANWSVPPISLKISRKRHSWRYYFYLGIERYKLGYEPIHIIERFRAYKLMNCFLLFGYVTALLKRLGKYEFADWVFRTQLKRLFQKKIKIWKTL